MTEPATVAVVRLWAEAAAGMIDVAQAFWNGLINLNPVERDTWSASGEGSTVVAAVSAPCQLQTSPFLDAHGQAMDVATVTLDPAEVAPGTEPIRVHVRVRAATTCHGRYTAALLDRSGTQVSNRFSVYMAQTGS